MDEDDPACSGPKGLEEIINTAKAPDKPGVHDDFPPLSALKDGILKQQKSRVERGQRGQREGRSRGTRGHGRGTRPETPDDTRPTDDESYTGGSRGGRRGRSISRGSDRSRSGRRGRSRGSSVRETTFHVDTKKDEKTKIRAKKEAQSDLKKEMYRKVESLSQMISRYQICTIMECQGCITQQVGNSYQFSQETQLRLCLAVTGGCTSDHNTACILQRHVAQCYVHAL